MFPFTLSIYHIFITVPQVNDSMFQLKYRKDGFASPTSEGAVLKYDGELYELLKNPVADKSYQLLCQVKDHGFVQNREHLKDILVENASDNR